MKILNIHGFKGEADNKNYKALCGIAGAENIVSPEMDYMNFLPLDIVTYLEGSLTGGDMLFVGQSLGGWFADFLSRKYSRPCILTNPCYFPHRTEIIVTSGISAEILAEYEKLSARGKNPLAHALCSDGDTVIDGGYADCLRLAGRVTDVHGSHSTIEDLPEHLRTAVGIVLSSN